MGYTRVRLSDMIHRVTDDATITFGIEAPYGTEIVGPMKPRSIHFGQFYGSDSKTGEFTIDGQPLAIFPMAHMDWNKYRPDLPPWDDVQEFVIADTHNGEVVEYTWTQTTPRAVATTGDLKTVSIHASGIREGVDGHVIDKERVAEHRRKTER